MGNSKTRTRYMRHRQENYLFKMKYVRANKNCLCVIYTIIYIMSLSVANYFCQRCLNMSLRLQFFSCLPNVAAPSSAVKAN